ncbi:MAG TPA: hypothetical protein PKA59_05570, partial [Chakrabartia sp.]|nr:hypothetical protein [Chakrabartia sp.]
MVTIKKGNQSDFGADAPMIDDEELDVAIRFRKFSREYRSSLSHFVGGNGQSDERLGWAARRRIMSVLRQATRISGPGKAAKVGRLGGGAAVAALVAGFVSPAMAQYAAGGGTATGANSVAIGTGASATGINGVATGTSNVATGDAATAVGSNNSVNSFDAFGAIISNGIFDRAVGGNYSFPIGGTGVNSYAVGIGASNTVSVG